MSKRWMKGQLTVLVVCALCLAFAWFMGKIPQAGPTQDGATLEKPGLLLLDTSLKGEVTQGFRTLFPPISPV